MEQQRIIITGIGIVSPIGIGKDEFWNSLKDGIPGTTEISLFDTSEYPIHKAGEIKDFDPVSFLGKKGLRSLDRSTLLLNTAAKIAIDDSQLAIDETNSDVIGVSVGTTFGSLHSIASFDMASLTEGPKFVNPSLFPNTVINSPASQVSIRFNIKGFNSTISTGMCASLDAIMYAADFIKLGRVDAVLAGGVEELCEETFLGFYKTGRLSGWDGSGQINCPYDARRNGFVLSEGSAILILESLESARKREVPIYAEVLGYANGHDPSNFLRYEGDGLTKTIFSALDDAGLTPSDIDLVCSGANSSREGDRMEARVLNKIFVNHADRTSISAVKSMIGEAYSASGALAVAAGIGAILNSFVPPTLNYSVIDNGCDLPGIAVKKLGKEIKSAIVIGHDLYGNNSVIVMGKYK